MEDVVALESGIFQDTHIVDDEREHSAAGVVLPFAVRSNQAQGAGRRSA